MKDKFIIPSRVSYPDPLEPNKETTDYGLKMAKLIESQWFHRPENGTARYYEERERIHEDRLYARGEQATDLYKKLLTDGEDGESYTNYDWRPLQIMPKYVKLNVSQMSERLYDLSVEAVDELAQGNKADFKRGLEKKMIAKPMLEDFKNLMGIDMLPEDPDQIPESQEEIDLYTKLSFKPAVEVAVEECLKHTLKLNDYEAIQEGVLKDIVEIGIGGVKHTTDPSKGFVVEQVDPADIVYSFSNEPDFKNNYYWGEVKRITLNELQRISGESFTREELEDLKTASNNWNTYHSESGNFTYRDNDLDAYMIDVLFFNYKTTEQNVYKKRYNKKGGFNLSKKSADFKKPDPNYPGYDVKKETYEVWYEGMLVLGTDKLFNYKKCENMIRPKSYLKKALPNYVMFAPEIYQGRIQSMTGRVKQYIDNMQQAWIKIQQQIAKAKPPGVTIDIAGLQEVNLGDGQMLSVSEILKIYQDTGSLITSSVRDDGMTNNARAIVDLPNTITNLAPLMETYNFYLNQLRDTIGMPQGADATMPHPDTAVAVQEQVRLSSNVATRYVLNAQLKITKKLCDGLYLRLADMKKYPNIRKAYQNAVGNVNIDLIQALDKFHLHDFGIFTALKPDAQDKQLLEQNIQAEIAAGRLRTTDAIDIRNVGNIKLANELLKLRVKKREKQEQQNKEQLIRVQSEEQTKTAQAQAQAKMQEEQTKAQAKLQEIQSKHQSEMEKLREEARLKLMLMQEEFKINMQLQGMETEKLKEMEKYKEDRKDDRTKLQATQQAELIDQRQRNTPPKKFESTNDGLSRGIDLGSFEPS